MPTQRPLREMLPDIMQHIRQHREYLAYNNRLMLVHEGQLRDEIEQSLRAELSPASAAKAIKRVPSINLLVRIVDKLSRVYAEPTLRSCVDKTDQELVSWFEKVTSMDAKLASANRMLNLHKCVAIEPFVKDGQPHLRVVPAHQFLVYSDDPIDPLCPTVYIKIMGRELKHVQFTDRDGRKIQKDEMQEVEVYYLYSDNEFLVVDSDGEARDDKLAALGNPSGINPIGVIPCVYVNRSDFRLIPVPDTDTLDNTILIPKLLADLNYAVQFQSHSILVAVDLAMPSDVVSSPDSIWNLNSTSEEGKQGRVDSIKPSVDIEKVLMLIESTLAIWLESRNVRAGTMGQIQAKNAASGVAKIIDEADATQDRQAQCAKFAVAELKLWKLIARLQAYWAETKQVQELRKFSDAFPLTVQFPELQPIKTDKDRLEEAKGLLDAGLLNKRQAIQRMFPHLDEESLNKWVVELEGAPSFNGAQIEAMLNAVAQSATGAIPKETLTAILVEVFGLRADKAKQITDPIKEGGALGNQDKQPQGPVGQGAFPSNKPGDA